MTNTILKVWIILLTLPTIPVIVLYKFFAGQNYFELKDTARGIVAVGPIAAYVVLVFIGWRIYMRISTLFSPESPAMSKLPGKWTVRSESSHGRVLEGSCLINKDKGGLIINGEFTKDGKLVGDWHSEMTHLVDNRFHVFYRLKEIKENKIQTSDGLCTLSFGSDPITEMNGIWAVVGEKQMFGTVKYTKL